MGHSLDARLWSPKETESLVKMCRGGYSVDEISARLGRTRDSVKAKANKEGFNFRGGEEKQKPAIPMSVESKLNRLRSRGYVCYNLYEKGRPDLWRVGNENLTEEQVMAKAIIV